jgi:hypothetical protein
MAITFQDVQSILENSVNGDDIGEHGNFWRTTLEHFKTLVLFPGTRREKQVLIVGDGPNSNLIKALRGNRPSTGRTPRGCRRDTTPCPTTRSSRFRTGLTPVV